MPIVWTEELRELVFSERGKVNPAYLPRILEQISSVKTPRFPFDVAQTYAHVRDWDHKREIARVRNGRDSAPAKLRPLLDRVIEERTRKKAPAGALDVDVEAATVALDLAHTWSAVPYWIAKEGVGFALRALVRCHAFEPSHHRHGYGSNQVWIEESWAYASEVDALHGWHVLRACLAGCDDRTYAAAERIAGELRATAPLCVRAGIAFAFPTAHAWANADAEEVIAAKRAFEGHAGILITLADSNLAEKLAGLPEVYLDDEWLATILAKHGESAARVIGAAIASAGTADARKTYAKALACVDNEEAARVFAGLLTNKAVAPIATKYFKTHPDLAKSALRSVAAGKSKASAAASLVLETTSPPPARPKNAKATAGTNVPSILAAPPWKAQRAAPVVLETKPIAFEARLAWAPGEVEALRKQLREWDKTRRHRGGIIEASTDDKLVAWLTRSSAMPFFWISHIVDTARAVKVLETFRTSYWWSGAERGMQALLARHGLAALPGLLRFGESRATEAIVGLAHVVSPEVAPFMADARARLKTARADADRWLLANVEAAVIGLVPLAVGKPGAKRASAESALLFLRESGHEKKVLAVAARFGARVRDAVATIDPLLTFPDKLPKLPAFANVRALPSVELRAGGALPDDAVASLLVMLAFYNPASPYAGLALATNAIDPKSLRDFTWALFERWLAAGAPPKEGWALQALAIAGDDDTAARLTPLVRTWPKEKAIARASAGLEVLGRIGTDLALMHIDALSRGFRYASVQARATALIEEAAARRGLSPDELADRVVPHLDADIDEPLKKETKAIVTRQLERLEQAMCSERTWSASEMELLVCKHPLVVQIARRLVWRATTPKGARTLFRVVEDGTLATVSDRPVKLADGARVAIVHRLRLSDDELAGWSKSLADYEIIQPFEQLGRAVYARREAFGAGTTIEAGRVNGLAHCGWTLDGDSWVSALSKHVSDFTITITIDPGYAIGEKAEAQTIKSIEISEGNRPAKWSRLGEIAYSELRRGLGGRT